MKVLALVSGGKDSCYTIHLAQQQGHQVVALGNLCPASHDVDDLDSYMYQTVGHQLVAAYAACTGLPLVRRTIMGASREQGLAYSPTEGDEVEDLMALVAFAKERYPAIEAVASGAIASDYQRLRVENVCSRLGLVSLAPLWRQPQDPLLNCMVRDSIGAILVKVAALGLEPHKHLGRTIAQMQPVLQAAARKFGCNVCGEGGEYETLTLDCPAFLHARIVLDSWEVVPASGSEVNEVAVLHATAFHLEPKDPTTPAASLASQVLEVPPTWRPTLPPTAASPTTPDPDIATPIQAWHSARYCTLSCAPISTSGAPPGAPLTQAAMHASLIALRAEADARGLQWDAAVFVRLYLADMAHFGPTNAAYCRHLPQVNPPSRACVQAPLPPGCPLMVIITIPTWGTGAPPGGHAPPRKVLHVQSTSSWAPSCIGPYSQATTCGGLAHVAGQIPLDPPTMSLPADPPAIQTERAMQHCQSVAVAVGACFERGALAYTVFVSTASGPGALGEVQDSVAAKLRAGAGSEDEEEGEGWVQDEYLRPIDVRDALHPVPLYIAVPQLPRGAAVEVQPVLLDLKTLQAAQQAASSSSDSEEEGEEVAAASGQGIGVCGTARGTVEELVWTGKAGWVVGSGQTRRPGGGWWGCCTSVQGVAMRLLVGSAEAGGSDVRAVAEMLHSALSCGRLGWGGVMGVTLYCTSSGREEAMLLQGSLQAALETLQGAGRVDSMVQLVATDKLVVGGLGAAAVVVEVLATGSLLTG